MKIKNDGVQAGKEHHREGIMKRFTIFAAGLLQDSAARFDLGAGEKTSKSTLGATGRSGGRDEAHPGERRS